MIYTSNAKGTFSKPVLLHIDHVASHLEESTSGHFCSDLITWLWSHCSFTVPRDLYSTLLMSGLTCKQMLCAPLTCMQVAPSSLSVLGKCDSCCVHNWQESDIPFLEKDDVPVLHVPTWDELYRSMSIWLQVWLWREPVLVSLVDNCANIYKRCVCPFQICSVSQCHGSRWQLKVLEHGAQGLISKTMANGISQVLSCLYTI